MSILTAASGRSVWRGYDYYKENKVVSCEQTDKTQFTGKVQGHETYSVTIDYAHLRRSVCSCPHAAGGRIVCKHMVALYFTAFPKDAELLYKQNEYWEQVEEQTGDIYDRIRACIRKMSAKQLKEELFDLLTESPDWVIDRFVSDHCPEERNDDAFYEMDRRDRDKLISSVKYSMEHASHMFYYDRRSKKVEFNVSLVDEESKKPRGNNILWLPEKGSYDETKDLQRFISLQRPDIRDKLTDALRGKTDKADIAAVMDEIGLGGYWEAYRDECLRMFAEEWCGDNIE